jgi:hypothetical protein
MRHRPLAVVTAALAAGGLLLTTAAASPGERPSRPLTAEGLVAEWDAAAGTVLLEDAELSGGPKHLRRALRRVDEVELGIGPRTRIVIEDEAGRERISLEDLFAELDAAGEGAEVHARGRLAAGAGPSAGAVPELAASRVVVELPAPDDEGDWGDDDGGEELPVLPEPPLPPEGAPGP